MNQKTILLLLIVVIFSSHGFSQTRSVKDSISTFYDSLFYHLEARYLYKKDVDWRGIKPFFKRKALESKSLEASFKLCAQLFDTIKGSHLNLFSKKGWYKSTLGKPLGKKDFHSSFLKKYAKKPGFEVKLLKNRYGYVMIPGMLLMDISQDSLDRKAQDMYDQIMQIQQAKTVKGWIIDLRFNVGGNVYPMLASLYHLLGNTVVYRVLNIQHKALPNQAHTVKKGCFYSGDKKEVSVTTTQSPDLDIPVALIIGKMSASAGELVAVGFRGRRNVVTIGEESYGMLTCNDMVQLPYGAKLTLTYGYLADRKEAYTPSIVPKIKVIRQANFENLTKDQNIVEAIRFIDSVK